MARVNVLISILLWLAVVYRASALTSGEERAILALRTSMPGLASANPPWTTNTSLACEPPGFYGLSCTSGTVTTLKLDIDGLEGFIPPEIGLLFSLRTLSIRRACLLKVFPLGFEQLTLLVNLEIVSASSCLQRPPAEETPAFLTGFKSLDRLILHSPSIGGTLPSNIGSMSQLSVLSLKSTRFRGVIPSSIRSLTLLRQLVLEETDFTNFENATFLTFPELQILSFAGSARLRAPLAGFLVPSLLDLNLSNTTVITVNEEDWGNSYGLVTIKVDNMRGFNIGYAFWSKLRSLTHFSAVNTQMSDGASYMIGYDIGGMDHLRYLDLSDSKVDGKIPASIARCPLKFLRLSRTFISPPLPDFNGQISDTLEKLYLDDLKWLKIGPSAPTIPASIAKFSKLTHLSMSSLSLEGTIPSNFSQLTSLVSLVINNNALTGELPAIAGNKSIFIDAHTNRLSGTIPRALASRASVLRLSNNDFSGTIHHDLFEGNTDLSELSLSHNDFSGRLPDLTGKPILSKVDMTSNAFTDDIPDSYCYLKELWLANNKLSGSLHALTYAPNCTLERVYLGYNNYSSGFPNIDMLSRLRVLSIPINGFVGSLPRLPLAIRYFDASSNLFDSTNFDYWMWSEGVHGLNHLDLSNNLNLILNEEFTNFVGENLTFLSLANVPFYPIPISPQEEVRPALLSLDLSNTNHIGIFPTHLYPGLTSLKLYANNFEGYLELNILQDLRQIDISQNNFEFEASQFSNLPLLTEIIARKNHIYGSLALDNLMSVQVVDLSANKLDHSPDLSSVSALFSHAQLKLLNISNNFLLRPMNSLGGPSTGLARTEVSAPSKRHFELLTCFNLAFNNKTDRYFIFDEDLFSYLQCDCNQKHFGSPPRDCIPCPSPDGIDQCGGDRISVLENSYLFEYDLDDKRKNGENGENQVVDGEKSRFVGGIALESKQRVETESCLVTTVQTLSRQSNCRGILITSDQLNTSSWPALLEPQCRPGSEGRLCSKCSCNASGAGDCYYQSGPRCSKCKHVFSLTTSIPFAFGLLVLVIIVLSFVMMIMLRRKRKQSLQSFSDLPAWKRFSYRVLYLVSLGHVSILVTFLQMLLAFTQWDAYARVGFLSIINGGGEGLALQCVFPLLSDPLWLLLSRLGVPFVAIIVVAISVGIGSQLAKCLDSREKRRNYDRPARPLLSEKQKQVDVEYPAFALLTSLSITVLKFFYFGTALAAHESLFSVSQHSTGTRYAQNKPFMTYKAMQPLIMASIPAILIFDFAIPLMFILICYRLRGRLNWDSVQIYYGSLFEVYDRRCFWWEIVNTFKKLAIALVLQGFPANDAAQSALVVTVLAITAMTQQRLNPWRRKSENIADGISALLLIAALIYTRPLQFTHETEITWYIAALSIVYILGSVGIILWETWTGITDYEKCLNAVLSSPKLNAEREVVFGGESMDEWSLNSETEWRMLDPDLHSIEPDSSATDDD